KFVVIESEERHPQRRVDHLGLNAVDVLIFDALCGIPSAGTSGLVAFLEVLFQLLAALADAETAGDGEWPHAGREEKVALAGFALYDFGCAVAELVVKPFLPQVSGFHHVGIGRNHAHFHRKSLLNSEGSPFWRRSSIELYRITKGWMARPEIPLGVRTWFPIADSRLAVADCLR